MFRPIDLFRAAALPAALLCAPLAADDLKVAIQEPRCGEELREEARLVKDQFSAAITNARGFQVFDRANTDQIMSEHGFVRESNLFAGAEARGLGEFEGTDYVVTSEISMLSDASIRVAAQALDIKTGRVVGSGSRLVEGATSKRIMEACQDLMAALLKQVNVSTSTSASASPGQKLEGLDGELQRLLMNNRSNPKWNANKGGYALEIDLSGVTVADNRQFGTTRVGGRVYFTLTDPVSGNSAGAELELREFTEMTKELIQRKIREQVQQKATLVIRDLLTELDQ